MSWGFRIRAIVATIVIVVVPLALLDAVAAQDQPLKNLVQAHPIVVMIGLVLSFVMSVNFADWLLDAELAPFPIASVLSFSAVIAQTVALVMFLMSFQRLSFPEVQGCGSSRTTRSP